MADKHEQKISDLVGPDRGWIAAQTGLFAVVAVAPPIETLSNGQALRLGHPAVNVAGGVVLIVGAMAISGKAHADLGRSFSMSPTPLEQGKLVDTGIYGVVRHPMYFAVFLLLLGWSVIWGAISGLVLTVISVSFFTLKSRHEEHKLRERYPGYQAYSEQVRHRFIPGLW